MFYFITNLGIFIVFSKFLFEIFTGCLNFVFLPAVYLYHQNRRNPSDTPFLLFSLSFLSYGLMPRKSSRIADGPYQTTPSGLPNRAGLCCFVIVSAVKSPGIQVLLRCPKFLARCSLRRISTAATLFCLLHLPQSALANAPLFCKGGGIPQSALRAASPLSKGAIASLAKGGGRVLARSEGFGLPCKGRWHGEAVTEGFPRQMFRFCIGFRRMRKTAIANGGQGSGRPTDSDEGALTSLSAWLRRWFAV